jgi:hypothetical protein
MGVIKFESISRAYDSRLCFHGYYYLAGYTAEFGVELTLVRLVAGEFLT